jgi:Asp-tRNA(Asn)/Glu-tRNA(Gln) amidotransferase A subunit family amidase
MRPSQGRYPGGGCVPLGRVDTPGPMGRTAADLALLDSVMKPSARSAASQCAKKNGARHQ